jgi:hypothetical protein
LLTTWMLARKMRRLAEAQKAGWAGCGSRW